MNSLLYRKQQLKYLASLLHVDTRQIQYAINNAENLYKEWDQPKRDKKTKKEIIKDGIVVARRLREAQEPLKKIQSNICRYILADYPLLGCVHGSAKKRSNITNAKVHQGNKYVFVTDLKNFYDTLSTELVYAAFLRKGFSHHIAEWLALLTTKSNSIPQGASTSSFLQNLLFRPADNMIWMYSKANNITYTRYIDDLTFSAPLCIKSHIPHILKLISKSKCLINYRKTAYSNRTSVTGIKVRNNYIDVEEHLKEHARFEQEVLKIRGPYSNYLLRVRSTNSILKVEV